METIVEKGADDRRPLADASFECFGLFRDPCPTAPMHARKLKNEDSVSVYSSVTRPMELCSIGRQIYLIAVHVSVVSRNGPFSITCDLPQNYDYIPDKRGTHPCILACFSRAIHGNSIPRAIWDLPLVNRQFSSVTSADLSNESGTAHMSAR
jgi:hypothetical protein